LEQQLEIYYDFGELNKTSELATLQKPLVGMKDQTSRMKLRNYNIRLFEKKKKNPDR